jgi:hypothetical protein
MRYRTRSLTWHGQAFRFEQIQLPHQRFQDSTWAVSRQGEFIGTMNCAQEITTEEFDHRCNQWLAELFQEARPTA